MGFASTSDWITKAITNAQVNRYDFNKTTATGPYVAGRWYDLALSGSYPPAITYGEWLTNPVPTGSSQGWTLTTGWTYNANTFVHASGSATTLSQAPLSCVSGRTYRVAFTIASNVGTGYTFALNGGSASALQTATGTVNLVAGANTALGLVITPGVNTNTVILSGLSIIETLGVFQITDTNPCGVMFTGGNVSTATKHVLDAGVMSAVATFVPGNWMLCDYLMCYPFIDCNSSAAQTLSNTGFSLPRYTTGVGVRAFLVQSVGTYGAGASYVTLNYTNSAGSAANGQTPGQQIAISPSAIAGTVLHSGVAANNYGPFLPLCPGDNGIQSVQSIQYYTAAGGTAGTYATLVLARPLLTISSTTASVQTERDFMNQLSGMPRIYDGAYLNWLFCPGAATVQGSQATGYIDVCWG